MKIPKSLPLHQRFRYYCSYWGVPENVVLYRCFLLVVRSGLSNNNNYGFYNERKPILSHCRCTVRSS